MSELGDRNEAVSAVEREELQRDARAPEEAGPPQGILLGVGGDPLMLGLPAFIVGSIAVGFVLTGYVSATSLGTFLPLVAGATALGQWISCRWAINLGQSIVASIFGVFGGFWTSLALLVFGLNHNWFVIPPADVAHSEIIFYLSWDIIILFLGINMLRLPVLYTGLIVFVEAALTLLLLGVEYPGSATTFNHLAGIAVFVFCGIGAWAYLNVGSVSLGGPAKPGLGPPLIK